MIAELRRNKEEEKSDNVEGDGDGRGRIRAGGKVESCTSAHALVHRARKHFGKRSRNSYSSVKLLVCSEYHRE